MERRYGMAGAAAWQDGAAPAAGTAWWRAGAPRERAPRAGARRERPGSPAAFAGLLVFTVVLLVSPQTFVPWLGDLRPALVAAAFATAAFLADRWRAGRSPLHGSREVLLAGGLLVWAVVTTPLSLWPGGSVSFLLEVYLKTLALFWLASHVIDSRARLRAVAWTMALLSAVPAAVALENYAAGDTVWGRATAYTSAFGGNPNDLALMLALVVPLAIALLASTRRPAARLLLAAVIVLDVAAVIVTFSRAGFLALACMLALALWKFRRRLGAGTLAAAAALAVLALPLLPATYVARMATITDIGADETGSAQERWSETRAAVRLVLRHPVVGSGIGTDTLALNAERGALWKNVHNVYLQYGVELGVPGLALFVALLLAAIRSARWAQRRSARAPDAGELGALAAGIEISLLTFAVGAAFSTAGYHVPYYYVAALAVAARRIAGAEAPAPRAALARGRR